MRTRRNDNFYVSFASIITGVLLGLSLIPLTVFIATLPYYAYVSKPIYLFLLLLFLVLFILYWVAFASQRRKKHYVVLYSSGVFSLLFPFLTSLTFTFGYPHVHQTLYIELMNFTGLLVQAKRFSMNPVSWHYLIGLSSMLPGIITGIVFLSAYSNKKRIHDAEYHQPKKKNYFYF